MIRTTGHEFEEDILCRVSIEASVKSGWRPYEEALGLVRKNQPKGWDPTDPPSHEASDLHCLVCDALGEDDYSQCGLFTALGSSLDVHHGVDAFFEYMGTVVTIDVTLNTKKRDHKANFVVQAETFENVELLRLVAESIARTFFQKLGPKRSPARVEVAA